MSQGYHNTVPVVTIPPALPPNGAASGDLSSSYPAPVVAKIRGRVVSATALADGQSYVWDNATNALIPQWDRVLTTAVSVALSVGIDKVIVNNGAAAVTITLPAAAGNLGKTFTITRGAGSTGTITVTSAGGAVQAMSGAIGVTTTISAHNAAGAGIGNQFTSNGTSWFR